MLTDQANTTTKGLAVTSVNDKVKSEQRRSKMTVKSARDKRIRNWHLKSEAEFEEKVKKETDLPTGGLPESVLNACAHYDRNIHERNQYPLGMFLDLIDMRHLGDRRATMEQLLMVANTGRELFLAAILHPDVTDEFLEEARSLFGSLVDTALHDTQEYYRRDPVTGEETYHGRPH
jgi:hypothetical protein